MSADVLDRPVEGPSSWLGCELSGSREWIQEFTHEQISELEAAAGLARATGKKLEDLTREDFPLSHLVPVIDDWMRELDRGRGFLLLRGLPVERWGLEISQLAYLALGLHMGELSSQNAAGDLLGHVRDSGADPNDPAVRLYKTAEAQPFHTDGADVIGLLCLRGAKSGGTSRIVSSVSVFNAILEERPELAGLMFQPFHFDRNEEQAEGEAPSFAIPLCHYDGNRLRTFYIGWYIRGAQRHPEVPKLSEAQNELLDLIDATAADPRLYLDMEFQCGDIQLLKNSTILHARTAYEDWEDPARKRHLLRIWINARSDFSGVDTIVKGVPQAPGATSDADSL